MARWTGKLPADGLAVDRGGTVVGDVNLGGKCFVGLPYGFLELGERHHGRTELAETLWLDEPFGIPEGIEQTDEGCSLTGEVVQVEQLESTLLRGLHGPFYLLLVEDGSQSAGGLQIVVGLVDESFPLQVVANGLEIQWVKHTGVFLYLVDVGIDAVLTYLVRDEWDGDVSGRFAIVAFEVGHPLVEHTLSAHPSVVGPLGDENVVFGFLVGAVAFLEGEGRRHVQVAWVLRLHVVSQFVQEVEVGLQLVAAADDAQRGVVAVVADDVVELVVEEPCRGTVFVDRQRPVGQFHLTVEAHLVGHAEGCLGRAPRVEPQVVEAVLTSCGKHLHPTTLVGGWCTGQGENAALQRSAQEGGLAVDEQSVALCLETTHAEGDGLRGERGVGGCQRHHGEGVEVGLELTPQLHVADGQTVFVGSCFHGFDRSSVEHEKE